MAVRRFPVEAGHILMFARSVGDPNPIYADPEYASAQAVGGVIAPPTFVQASAQFDDSYPLRPTIGQPWFGSGRTPSGLTRGGGDRSAEGTAASTTPAADAKPETTGTGGGNGGVLHAEQHYEYHRPLLAGEVLTATTTPGRTWTKEGRRGGTLAFSEAVTEYRTEGGELVVTARSVGVRTGAVVKQES